MNNQLINLTAKNIVKLHYEINAKHSDSTYLMLTRSITSMPLILIVFSTVGVLE